jgi:hypothetical protein
LVRGLLRPLPALLKTGQRLLALQGLPGPVSILERLPQASEALRITPCQIAPPAQIFDMLLLQRQQCLLLLEFGLSRRQYLCILALACTGLEFGQPVLDIADLCMEDFDLVLSGHQVHLRRGGIDLDGLHVDARLLHLRLDNRALPDTDNTLLERVLLSLKGGLGLLQCGGLLLNLGATCRHGIRFA